VELSAANERRPVRAQYRLLPHGKWAWGDGSAVTLLPAWISSGLVEVRAVDAVGNADPYTRPLMPTAAGVLDTALSALYLVAVPANVTSSEEEQCRQSSSVQQISDWASLSLAELDPCWGHKGTAAPADSDRRGRCLKHPMVRLYRKKL
jgi:hypothetical protein